MVFFVGINGKFKYPRIVPVVHIPFPSPEFFKINLKTLSQKDLLDENASFLKKMIVVVCNKEANLIKYYPPPPRSKKVENL